jgi:uncharacterized lipoprotein YddW (UPF0748 family)
MLRTRLLSVWAGLIVLLVVVGTFYVQARQLRGSNDDTQREVPVADSDVGTCGGRPVDAPRDLRAMWLTTVNNIDWPSRPGMSEDEVKQEYLGWLDLAQKYHHNAIFVHIRPSGDAFWPSPYAPWSQWLTGKTDGSSPGWDPLQWAVTETHKRNIEFHAWFNPYRGDQPAPLGPGADLTKLAPDHPLLQHPEWRVVYPQGTKTSRLYFDPGIPAARKFVEDSMLDAVARYDIDAVDFDDFFYPYPEGAKQDFNDAASYAEYGHGQNKADWRRDNVNTMVREMSERIKALKPWVKFGISPFGIWRNNTTDPAGSATHGLQSYDDIYADTRTWVKQHWVDYIMPQLYWTIGNPPADYAVLIEWWSKLVAGSGVQLYVAHGDYRVGEPGAWSDPAELGRQFALDQRYQVQGNVDFSAMSIRNDALGAISRSSSTYFGTPALLPQMARLPVDTPAVPSITTVRADGDAVTVSWRPGRGTAATSYAVYRLDPGADTAHLVGSVRDQSFVDHGAPAGSQYCVSGLDRSANQGRLSATAGTAG